jgi:hypothetical protein
VTWKSSVNDVRIAILLASHVAAAGY